MTTAEMTRTEVAAAKLNNAVLDQAWGLTANFDGAKLGGASLIARCAAPGRG